MNVFEYEYETKDKEGKVQTIRFQWVTSLELTKKNLQEKRKIVLKSKKQNEGEGFINTRQKDIIKLGIFFCILFLLFFFIHSTFQKSLEAQIIEVHDTYLILKDLNNSEEYLVPLVGKETTDFNTGDLVVVAYNGSIDDVDPASLGGVTKIEHMKK